MMNTHHKNHQINLRSAIIQMLLNITWKEQYLRIYAPVRGDHHESCPKNSASENQTPGRLVE